MSEFLEKKRATLRSGIARMLRKITYRQNALVEESKLAPSVLRYPDYELREAHAHLEYLIDELVKFELAEENDGFVYLNPATPDDYHRIRQSVLNPALRSQEAAHTAG